jgi:hypothetical protein
MAEFILPANQKIIWDTLQKHPYCSIVFPPGSDQAKINWFKNIMSETYYSIQGKTIIRSQLIQINKNVLKRMLNELKEIIDSMGNKQNYQSINNQQNNNNPVNIFQENPIKNETIKTETSYSRESILENKNTEFQNSLEQRQREYGDLFKKPTPPIVDFEQANDSVIQNMDELIQQQLRERENDLKQISNNIKPITIQVPVKTTVKIQEPAEINNIIELEVDTLPDIKKRVSWDLNIQENIIQGESTEKNQNKLEIDKLNIKYTRLIDFLEIKLPNFKNEFSQYQEQEQEEIL